MSEPHLAIEARGLSVAYGARRANDAIDWRVRAGSVHALVGENGAGKSTLMHAVAGLVRPVAGALLIGGQHVATERAFGLHDAVAYGVGLVHQHVMLVPSLSVCDNVVLGAEPRRLGLLDRDVARARTRELSAAVGVPLDPDGRAGDLSLGERQALEIVKVLYRGAEILLLDEPTAVLTPPEVERFFAVLRRLRDEGHTIVIVTHRLDEVLTLAEDVTILRRGRVVHSGPTAGQTVADLGRLLVGDSALPGVDTLAAPGPDATVRLRVSGLRVLRGAATPLLDGVDLEVREGEILGLAGVEGNGQDVLVEVIAGLRVPSSGTVSLDGKDLGHASIGQRLQAGLAHVPEDRRDRGLLLGASVAANMVLGRERDFARGRALPVVDDDAVDRFAAGLVATLDVRPPEASVPVLALSGGNQQKVVVAREIGRSPRVLLAAQPTRGVDLGAMARIHRAITDFARSGGAVIVLSADLGELLALCHRVAVFRRGRIVAALRPEQTDARSMGAIMVGLAAEPSEATP